MHGMIGISLGGGMSASPELPHFADSMPCPISKRLVILLDLFTRCWKRDIIAMKRCNGRPLDESDHTTSETHESICFTPSYRIGEDRIESLTLILRIRNTNTAFSPGELERIKHLLLTIKHQYIMLSFQGRRAAQPPRSNSMALSTFPFASVKALPA